MHGDSLSPKPPRRESSACVQLDEGGGIPVLAWQQVLGAEVLEGAC